MLRRLLFSLLLLGCGGPDQETPKGGPWEPCLDNATCEDDSVDRCFYFYGGQEDETSVCAPKCLADMMCPPGHQSRSGLETSLTCDYKGFCLLECIEDSECPAGMKCLTPGDVSDLVRVCVWEP